MLHALLTEVPFQAVPWRLRNCNTFLMSKETPDLDTIPCLSRGKHPDTRLTQVYVNPQTIL